MPPTHDPLQQSESTVHPNGASTQQRPSTQPDAESPALQSKSVVHAVPGRASQRRLNVLHVRSAQQSASEVQSLAMSPQQRPSAPQRALSQQAPPGPQACPTPEQQRRSTPCAGHVRPAQHVPPEHGASRGWHGEQITEQAISTDEEQQSATLAQRPPPRAQHVPPVQSLFVVQSVTSMHEAPGGREPPPRHTPASQ